MSSFKFGCLTFVFGFITIAGIAVYIVFHAFDSAMDDMDRISQFEELEGRFVGDTIFTPFSNKPASVVRLKFDVTTRVQTSSTYQFYHLLYPDQFFFITNGKKYPVSKADEIITSGIEYGRSYKQSLGKKKYNKHEIPSVLWGINNMLDCSLKSITKDLADCDHSYSNLIVFEEYVPFGNEVKLKGKIVGDSVRLFGYAGELK